MEFLERYEKDMTTRESAMFIKKTNTPRPYEVKHFIYYSVHYTVFTMLGFCNAIFETFWRNPTQIMDIKFSVIGCSKFGCREK